MRQFFYLLTAILFLCLNGYSEGTPQKEDSVKTKPDSILFISNLNSSRVDSASINDIIVIKLQTQKSFADFDTLYINGIKVDGTKPWKRNVRDSTIFFQLGANVQDVVDLFIQTDQQKKM